MHRHPPNIAAMLLPVSANGGYEREHSANPKFVSGADQ
jgi:hypothetical protein